MAIDETVNALIDAVEAIEQELGILPSSVYSTVRVRLDILEGRINNPNAPSPTVENPFTIGNVGTTISTGEGAPSGTQPPGSLYLRTDGYDANAIYQFRPDGYWSPIGTGGDGGGAPTGPAGGDLAGTYPDPTVGANKITNAQIRAAAALSLIGRSANSTGNVADIAGTNNQVLRISGSVLGFGAVDLSTAQVTGTLPTGNQAPQAIGGDVSGTTTSATVTRLRNTNLGTTVGTVGATQDGYALAWNNGSSEWRPTLISGGGGSPTGSAGGDLNGTYPNPIVRDLTITSEQQGSILYFNGTNWVQLSPSTAGYVLTTHSTGANPTWAASSGGGGGSVDEPLSNVLYVDGGTDVPDGYQNGAITTPYSTIEAAYAANPSATLYVTPGNYGTIAGESATISAQDGLTLTIIGLSGITSNSLGKTLVLSNSASNNGSFQIVVVNSATSVDIYAPSGVFPDANSGSIGWQTTKILLTNGLNIWSMRPPYTDVSSLSFGVYPSPEVISKLRSSGAGALPNVSIGYILNRGEPVSGQFGSSASLATDADPLILVVTGLTGMIEDSVGRQLYINNASYPFNNGFFKIYEYISATSVKILNHIHMPDPPFTTDPNNGNIIWEERLSANNISLHGVTFDDEDASVEDRDFGVDAGGADIAIAKSTLLSGSSPGQFGSAALIGAFTDGVATVEGLTSMTPASVGRYLSLSNAIDPDNNGIYYIVNYISSTSVAIYNAEGSGGDAGAGGINWTEYFSPVINARQLVLDDCKHTGFNITCGSLNVINSNFIDLLNIYILDVNNDFNVFQGYIYLEKTYIAEAAPLTIIFANTLIGTPGKITVDKFTSTSFRNTNAINILNGYLFSADDDLGSSITLTGLGAVTSGTLVPSSLVVTGGSNMFEVMVYVEVVTAGSSGTITLTLTYSDDAGSTTQSTTPLNINAPGRTSQKFIVHVSDTVGSQTITYSVPTITTPGLLSYNLRMEAIKFGNS